MQEEATPRIRAPNRRIDKDTVSDLMSEIIEMIINQVATQKEANNHNNLKFCKDLLYKTRVLEHDVLKLLKQSETKPHKKRASIFNKAVPITSELTKFLKLSTDTLSRAECTKQLHVYILKHKLQNPENKKEILPDAALAKLLNYDPQMDGPLYYTTLQKLIQKHFIKQE